MISKIMIWILGFMGTGMLGVISYATNLSAKYDEMQYAETKKNTEAINQTNESLIGIKGQVTSIEKFAGIRDKKIDRLTGTVTGLSVSVISIENTMKSHEKEEEEKFRTMCVESYCAYGWNRVNFCHKYTKGIDCEKDVK